MVDMTPIALQGRLSGRWEAVDPKTVGATASVFAAQCKVIEADFVPTITVDEGHLSSQDSARTLADHSLEVIKGSAEDVNLLERRAIGADVEVGLVQAVLVTIASGQDITTLRQDQVYTTFVDPFEGRAFVRVVLIALPVHHYHVFQDFQDFVRSISLDRN